eukprot:5907600-Pleurochrysis_carterae.AAC.1
MLSDGGARMTPRLRLSAAPGEIAMRCARATSADLLVACDSGNGGEATALAVVVEVVRVSHARA